MRKLTALNVVALAMMTANVALGETLMTQVVRAEGQHVYTTPFFGKVNMGQQYTLDVLLKNGQTRYYSGTFIGFMAVTDSNDVKLLVNHGWIPTGKPQKIATVDKNTAKQAWLYLAFKGAHSTLLYRDKSMWLIIEG